MAWPKGKPRKPKTDALAPVKPRKKGIIGGHMPPAQVVTPVDPGPVLGYRMKPTSPHASYKPNPV